MKHGDLQSSLVFSLLEDVDLLHRKGPKRFPSDPSELQQWIQDGSHPLLLPSRLLLQWTQSTFTVDPKLIVRMESQCDLERQSSATRSVFGDHSGNRWEKG